MGRVFDAIKRQSASPNGTGKRSEKVTHRKDSQTPVVLPNLKEVEEQIFTGSSIASVANEAVHSSASTAHTADVPGGSALPGGFASRDAGATLGAAGAARVGDFVTYDITPARVEPHLVAVSQP